MSKQAIMMVVDAGHSMDEMYSEYSSRLKLSLQCINLSLQQKVFNNSNHEVGFAIFGDNQVAGDPIENNYFLLSQLTKVNVEYIRKIKTLSQAKLQNQKPGGDIFRAINSAINELQNHCRSKKYNKRIFIFTNGMGETEYNEYHIKHQLAPKLRATDIKVNIIPINFMDGYNIEENQVETQIKNQVQIQNAQLLMDLKAEAEDNVLIVPDEIAIQLYRRFRKREVNPVAIYRGEFVIAPELSIEVQSYKLIRRERLKSLAKYDLNQPFNPIITKGKQILIENSYIIQGDETNTPIPPDNQTNAYQYGPHLIPISKILQNDAKWHQMKNFRLLGFVNKECVPRTAFMGQVEVIVPTKGMEHLAGQKLFTALIYSMLALSKYGIARYVPRNSKNGVTPRLVVLIPFRTHQKQGMYLIDLPTVEDVRTYPYNSLKPSTEPQKQLVQTLIKKMMLYHRNDQQQLQQLKIDTTFNPCRQYFFQSVFHRAIKPDDQLPPLDEHIRNYLTPEVRIYEDTADVMNAFRKEFKFTKKVLAKERLEKKKALLWKDVIENQVPTMENSATNSEIAAEELKPHKLFDESDDIDSFDSTNPLVSFNRMLSNNKVDLVEKALTSMSSYIFAKSQGLMTDDLLLSMLQCASELRRGCDQQQEKDYWDRWLDEARQKLPPKLYDRILSEGLCYLKKDNRLLIKVQSLHEAKYDIEELEDLD